MSSKMKTPKALKKLTKLKMPKMNTSTMMFVLIIVLFAMIGLYMCTCNKRKESAFLFPSADPVDDGSGGGGGGDFDFDDILNDTADPAASASAASASAASASAASASAAFKTAGSGNTAASGSVATVKEYDPCTTHEQCIGHVEGNFSTPHCGPSLPGKGLRCHSKKTGTYWCWEHDNPIKDAGFETDWFAPGENSYLPEGGCHCKSKPDNNPNTIEINGICFKPINNVISFAWPSQQSIWQPFKLRVFVQGRSDPLGWLNYSYQDGNNRYWRPRIRHESMPFQCYKGQTPSKSVHGTRTINRRVATILHLKDKNDRDWKRFLKHNNNFFEPWEFNHTAYEGGVRVAHDYYYLSWMHGEKNGKHYFIPFFDKNSQYGNARFMRLAEDPYLYVNQNKDLDTTDYAKHKLLYFEVLN